MPVSRSSKNKKKQKKSSVFQKEISIGGVSLEQKATIAKHLSVMLHAGLTVWEALDVIEDTSKGTIKNVVTKLKRAVEAGDSLAEAFAAQKKHFPKMFINVVNAGEQSGTLAENFEHLAIQLKKEQEIYQKVRSASAYPIIIFSASILLALGISYFILPQITPLFTGMKIELPWTTKMVIRFSDFMGIYGAWVIFGVLALFPLTIWSFRRPQMKPLVDWFLLRIPVVSMVSKKNNLARFSMTLGTLLRSGITIDEALVITSDTVSNTYYKRIIAMLHKRVIKGSNMADILTKQGKLFPKLIVSMIKVGEEAGGLEDSLLYVSKHYEEELDNATKTLTSMLEPLLLVFIGVIVAILALAIITPIYRVTGGVSI